MAGHGSARLGTAELGGARLGEARQGIQMKTILIILAFVVLFICGGQFALDIHTRHVARTRMLLYVLGDKFSVRAKITPVWGLSKQIGNYEYCDKLYSVSFQVKM